MSIFAHESRTDAYPHRSRSDRAGVPLSCAAVKSAREGKCVVCGKAIGEEPFLASYGKAGSHGPRKEKPEVVVHYKRECMDKYLKRDRKRA